MPSSALLEAVAVTAELCGRTFSEAAARVFVADLDGYDEQAVIRALSRCRKEVRGALTVADVVTRIEDGRPSADEAWAMLPRSEAETVVWTDEMAHAYGACYRLIAEGDQSGARMAFKAAYTKAINDARSDAKPARWSACLGFDETGRSQAIEAAVIAGRLPASERLESLTHSGIEQLAVDAIKRLQ